MIVRCGSCRAVFNLDERRIKEKGSNVRCSRCRQMFRIYPPFCQPPGKKNSAKKAYKMDLHLGVKKLPVPKPGLGNEKDNKPGLGNEEFPDPGCSSFPSPGLGTMEAHFNKIGSPFRTKLIYFAAAIIVFIAVIVIPVEAYRPLNELYQLIKNAENLIAGIYSAVDPSDIEKMNRFALRTISHSENISLFNTKDFYTYSSMAFNMILAEGGILPENEVIGKLEYLESFEKKFDYYNLADAFRYWEERFSSEPEMLQIFRKYKFILFNVKENTKITGFKLSEIYIMLDIGRNEGQFKNKVAFVLDSVPWWSATVPSYSGLFYDVSNDYWRELALSGRDGYGHNPTSDPNHWYMPVFAEDAWGSWFSVWLTKKSGNVYNMFNIDFDASSVKKLMRMVASAVAGVILLLSLMVLLITRWLSKMVTRPITELTRGAKAVAAGNYDYVVPMIKQDEFGELTIQFNMMTQGQKERLNLMQTLEKFLSKELAEMAAKNGIILGGQKADCTVMFTDFAGFSTITQKLNASESVEVLNMYFNALIPIIKKYGGFPDKYIGDAIVAMFGAPVLLENHAERAVEAAIEMQRAMRKINETMREEGKTFFEMRIGLNSGEVIAGAIGCDAKLEYTSIGETTNLANRMESACPVGHVKIAEGTYEKIKSSSFKGVDISSAEMVDIKGYNRPVRSYSIYVDNIFIRKDIDSKDIKSFYVYTERSEK